MKVFHKILVFFERWLPLGPKALGKGGCPIYSGWLKEILQQ